MIEIKVFDITGSRAVLDSPDGDTLFYQILENFKAGERVILSMFLNSAIAPLYEQYDSNFLNEHLVIKNMSEDDKITLKRVNSRAKQFYKEAKENSDLCMEEVYGE